jgi:hypothetical protein
MRWALDANYEASRTGRAGYICAVAILDTVGIAAVPANRPLASVADPAVSTLKPARSK